MPHGGHGGGHGGGIEGMTPPTGPLTAFTALGLFTGAIVFAWRHPRSAALGALLATVFAVASGSTAGTALTSPVALLFVIVAGFSIAGPSSTTTTQACTPVHIAQAPPITTVTTRHGHTVPLLTTPKGF